ncbi:MAG: hypothetical protein KKE64_07325 [Candidatus Omnitrophica bacterium]|nr:hypothetical protein [Candidatus Omnitrophota bacterium]
MGKQFSFKKLFLRIALLIPLIYIGFGWYAGLRFGRKGVILGPYPDIPVVMKTRLLGSSFEDISGSNALVMVAPPGEVAKSDQDSTYFNITGYFEVPGTWNFDFTPSVADFSFKKPFALTGSYSRAIAHELKNPKRRLGSMSLSQLNDYLKATGRTKDTEKLKPYLFLARLEEKYPWLYSDTVFLSRAMGNIFNDDMVPYDILGLIGLLVLFIALSIRSIWLWMYYLYWVFAYWLGRIGYHDSNLVMSNNGWQVILWSFWHGFIQKEGRLFLVIAIGGSVVFFGAAGLVHIISFLKGSLKYANAKS